MTEGGDPNAIGGNRSPGVNAGFFSTNFWQVDLPKP